MAIEVILLKLENDFKNVVRTNSHNAVYNHVFKVVDHIGNETAELFYSTEFNEWAVILDNFPSRRKHFSWTLPIKDIETLRYMFNLCGIELINKV